MQKFIYWGRELRETSEHGGTRGCGAMPRSPDSLHPPPVHRNACYYVETHPLKIKKNQPLHAHKKLFYLLLWHISQLEQLQGNMHSVDSSIVHYLLYWLVGHLVYLLSTLPCWESFLLMFFPACSG